jgi:hypothetical protein
MYGCATFLTDSEFWAMPSRHLLAPNWPANSATDSSKQGVVLHYPVVGRINNTAPIDPTAAKGRSAVHEIGHYLGLRHIWGDGGCSEDDGFTDTPCRYSSKPTKLATTMKIAVSTAPTDRPDQIENLHGLLGR